MRRRAPANIAEGFGRFSPREFARFLRIARGSLLETRNHVLKAKANGYVTDEDGGGLVPSRSRATGAVTNRALPRLCKGKATGWEQPEPEFEPNARTEP